MPDDLPRLYWDANTFLSYINGIPTRLPMREALARGWKLKPLDAIHLATAQQERATAFHTYDTELEKYVPIIGCPVSQPLARAPRLL